MRRNQSSFTGGLHMAGILLEGHDVTDAERAAHARALSSEKRAAALRRAAEMRSRVGEQKLAKALSIDGQVISDHIVDAGAHWSSRVPAGLHLRIIDLEGQQAVDFLCYDLSNLKVRYNAANTLKLNRSIYIGAGFKLYSDRAEGLMTVVGDTVGLHDTIGGCCSAEVNYLRYGIRKTPNCRDNFTAALQEHGLDASDIPANVNFFMYVPVRSDGSTEIDEGRSEPGDYVDLRADKDVLAVVSNCPQLYNPCNGWNPTPIRIIAWQPAG
jgi:urea carboxylase-associated protein 1